MWFSDRQVNGKKSRMRNVLLAAALAVYVHSAAHAETALFAGGCFWCVESDMDHVKGVAKTVSGYAGGALEKPTYRNHPGAREAVEVEFDPKVVSYDALVRRFLRTIDAVDGGGQFCDRGPAYASAIYAMNDAQKTTAELAVKDAEQALGQKLATPVELFSRFAPSEDYHQDYYMGQNRVLTRFGLIKQADAYKRYREACGRDARVKALWGDQAYTAGKEGAS
jgi:peptide-methionine (S)-S-oxide reductase